MRVLPVAADFPRTPRGEAASPARVLPEAVALAALVQKLIRSVVAALLEVSLAAHPRLWFQWHILQNLSENGNIPVQYSRNTQYPETTRLRPAAE